MTDTARKDGGPAFPTITSTENGSPFTRDRGMSLRDWFAGQALAGMLEDIYHQYRTNHGPPTVQLASVAYAIADAMLAERDR